jgi:hypothetical protein
MRWQKWDPTNAAQSAHAEKIHDSYPIMHEIVVLAYKEPEAKSTTFKRWFGPKDADNVKKVLGRIVEKVPTRIPTHRMENFMFALAALRSRTRLN